MRRARNSRFIILTLSHLMNQKHLLHRRVKQFQMSRRSFLKFGSFHPRIPLWKQNVPKYPVYVEGGPQNRVLLCHFWMKLVKPKRTIPKNQVHFEVHPQMSIFDVKQYLEKLYNVPVLDVRTKVTEGEEIRHYNKPHQIGRQDDKKFAYVTLANGQTFEFPDLFEDKKLPFQKDEEDFKKMKNEELKTEHKHWDRMSVPPWFR